jgi:hypothetical protein
VGGRGGGCKENDFNFRYANLMDSLSKIRMQTKGTAVAAHRGGDRIEMGKGKRYYLHRKMGG